jgi:hypothetical protein
LDGISGKKNEEKIYVYQKIVRVQGFKSITIIKKYGTNLIHITILKKMLIYHLISQALINNQFIIKIWDAIT